MNFYKVLDFVDRHMVSGKLITVKMKNGKVYNNNQYDYVCGRSDGYFSKLGSLFFHIQGLNKKTFQCIDDGIFEVKVIEL